MSTSAVTTNKEANARGAAITASDGFFFSLNDAYTSPGLIVATAAAEPAQERAQARTNGPVRHA